MLRPSVFRRCAAVALVAMMGTLVSVNTADAAMIAVDITPTESQVSVDETFDLVISADIELGILGFGFDLLFDDALVDVASVEIAEPFAPLNAPDGDGLAGLAYPEIIAG